MDEIMTERQLLEQIRDLLIPVSAVSRPQYEELVRNQRREQVDAIIEIVGQGAKRLSASKLLNGSRSRKEIADSAKIDSGELSRLVKALKDRELVVEEEGRPRLVVAPEIVWGE